ncbi:MAG TPA: DUF1572 family protein [Gemmataceae bacterium]|nr:DUF1572 family protein [Gemmataceae bacterium]
MSVSRTYLEEITFSFRKQKEWADKAFAQVQADSDFFRKPGEFSNSIAAIIKHVAGNLSSRWRDFLTSDGEKPDRDRDAEFVIGEQDSRANLIAAWERGWSTLFDTLTNLSEADFQKTIRIRGEEHTVHQALLRSLTHVAYHTGQIVYLSRLMQKEGWEWITIAPGQSRQFNEAMHAQQGKKYLG